MKPIIDDAGDQWTPVPDNPDEVEAMSKKPRKNSILTTRAYVHDNGDVEFIGMDMSNGNKPMHYVAHKDGVLVVRHPGGKCWAGVGMPQRHVAAHFIIFRYYEEESNGIETTYIGETLMDIPIREPRPK